MWIEYHDPPVTLHSGQESSWLIRGDIIFKCPDLRESVLATWEHALRAKLPNRHFWFFGIPTGGTAWAKAIADRMGETWIEEYKLPDPPPCNCPNPIVIVVDDVTTTGASLKDYPGRPSLVVVRRKDIPVLVSWRDIFL